MIDGRDRDACRRAAASSTPPRAEAPAPRARAPPRRRRGRARPTPGRSPPSIPDAIARRRRRPCASRDAHRLDRAVGRARLDDEPRAELADHLPVHRVHLDAARAEQLRELAVRLEIHVVRELEALVVRQADRRAVVEAARALLRLGDERAAERDVQLLEAAADGEERHAHLDRQRDELQRRRVAVGVVGLVALRRLLAVARRDARSSASRSGARRRRARGSPRRSSSSPRLGSSSGAAPAMATAFR